MMLSQNLPKKSAVMYHYPCPDGAFAALAAHLYFAATSTPSLFFPNTVYAPLRVQELPLHEIGDVYLLDFVGPADFVRDISFEVDRVVVLDHHKTALESLTEECGAKNNLHKVIDMKRSGATIAYDYFKEKLSLDGRVSGDEASCKFQDEHVKRLFDYIEDADLWKWSLQDSKAFSSGLKDLNIEFDVRLNQSLFEQLLSLNAEDIINQGLVSISQKQESINEILDQSFEIALGAGSFGHCLAVNADAVSELRSELGHQLANKSHKSNLRGVGAVVYKVPGLENDQKFKISLRSIMSEDTTSISQKFGGGGHRNASSFMLSVSEFEKWKV